MCYGGECTCIIAGEEVYPICATCLEQLSIGHTCLSRGIAGGWSRGTYLLFAVVLRPLTTHPLPDGVPSIYIPSRGTFNMWVLISFSLVYGSRPRWGEEGLNISRWSAGLHMNLTCRVGWGQESFPISRVWSSLLRPDRTNYPYLTGGRSPISFLQYKKMFNAYT